MSISRRSFLEATVAATTALALSGGKVGEARAAEPAHKVKRGVALYSYQEEYFMRTMSVEDCLRQLSDIGAYRIELLAEMMVPDFPNPSNAWVDQWHGWVDKYKLVPTCYTQFIDSMRTKTHTLTVEEGVQTMLRDIRLAKRLGIPKIRALVGTPVDILEATVPHLEKENVWLGVEIHFPIPIHGHLTERLLKIADKTDHFGFVPDFGIFQNKPNPYLRDRLVRDGVVTRDAALFIENAWENKTDKQKVLAEVKTMSGGAGAAGYVENVYGIVSQDPKDLLPMMSKCRHIHGKTWGLTEACVDPAIDLTQVIPTLIKGGYDGDIATEYEGQRWVQDAEPFSAVEMVDRHQVMLRRLLGEI
jgi:hypothetical protein